MPDAVSLCGDLVVQAVDALQSRLLLSGPAEGGRGRLVFVLAGDVEHLERSREIAAFICCLSS